MNLRRLSVFSGFGYENPPFLEGPNPDATTLVRHTFIIKRLLVDTILNHKLCPGAR